MTGALAARWARTVVPSWTYRWLLPVLWLGAILASTIGDTSNCSVEVPTTCGPDRTFSLAMIACFASLALLWWQPIVAALAGVVFMALDLRYDNVASARVAWTVYGVLCAVLLIWIVTSRLRQRSLAGRLQREQVHVPAAARIGVTSRLLVAVALVLVGAAAFGLMNWQDSREEAHLRRAVEQTAIAKGMNDDGDLTLQLPDGSSRTVSVAGDYDTGEQIAVLVDPADSHWIRLRAELADYTFWYTVAGGAWLLALLFLLRDLRLRRARPRRSWSGPAMPVRIDPHISGAFAVRSADGTVLLGLLDADLDDEESDLRLLEAFSVLDEEEQAGAPAKLRREWAQTLMRYRGDALLVGDLAEGSWPTLLLGSQALRPVSPFRAFRKLPWHDETASSLPTDFEPAEDAPSAPPVEPAREVPTLPWEVPLRARSWWSLPALIGVLVVGPVAVGTFASWGDWYAAVLATGIGAQLVHSLGSRALFRVTATATDLWIRTGWLERRLSWRAVDSVEVEEDGLSLDAGDEWHVVGGIADKELANVAAVFETLRLRSHTGLPEEPIARRPSPVLLINAVYVAVCVLILVLARWNPF
ncbi:hypothetical protein EV651_12024 [Kribbella sp. VKM Ac-2571]|uniref:hypothetical protein n=1 Tax=Kribbella sp. VKM Ac-2571 TaxID=2512222 RepID=UPI00105D350F|nr:hypothetical protein [Kribbella sp. VKM Ac-2571]TDO50340.1 hypothetical protein EV651_12024 [Kribbella sp. VKM Ac-2571]